MTNNFPNAGDAYILLVEDNTDDEMLILRALAQDDIASKVVVVRDGAAALAYLDRAVTLPCFVLLDLQLPKMNGLEVLQAVRANERTCLLPVVMLTSSTEQSDIMNSYQAGANSYICKPTDFSQFRTTIYRVGVYWLHDNRPCG